MAPRPTLVRERAVWAEEHLLVGVDEAGRGPLAGPVVAAAVVFPTGCSCVRGLRDSKILPASKRARLAERIRGRVVAFGIGAASAHEIDRFMGSKDGLPRTFTFDAVNFDSGTANLRGQDNGDLDDIARVLAAYPKSRAAVVG